MDLSIIAGNACSLCAMVTDSVSSTRKKRGEILAVQIISQVFYAAGSIILKGYSSTVQNAVAVLRNLAAIKNIKSRAVEWILIALGVVFGVVFNNRGLLGWLPIIANLEYSVAVFRFRDSERGLKLAFLVNAVMYCVFNFMIQNYVGGISCIVVAVTTAVFLIKGFLRKSDGKDNAEGNEAAGSPGDSEPG